MTFAPATRPLEKFALTSPLGLRFWDVGTGRPVPGGLTVSITAPHGPALPAVSTSSGAYAFLSLPGVRREPVPGTDDYFSDPPATVEFLVKVEDPQERFLPVQFMVPVPAKGFFNFPALTPGVPGGYVPLFSAPARKAPAGFATIRAQLSDAATLRPAAWAVLEAVAGSGPDFVRASGVADPTDGTVVIFLPYPESQDGVAESPPHPPRKLTDQTWTVQLTLRYDPGASPPFTPASVPLLDRILTQRPGTLLDSLSPLQSHAGAALRFGSDLVLRAAGSPPSATLFAQPFVV